MKTTEPEKVVIKEVESNEEYNSASDDPIFG